MKFFLLGLLALAQAKPNGNTVPHQPRQNTVPHQPRATRIQVRDGFDQPCDDSNKHCPRSVNYVPEIDIVFPNGHEDSLVLQRHYSNPEARMSGERHCNFFGHLRHDSKACVAVTGCYPEENMELTINSKHSTESNMFVLEKSGNLVAIESAFKDEKTSKRTAIKLDRRERYHPNKHDDDELVDDEVEEQEMAIEKLCASGNCKALPDKMSMKIKFGYEDTFYNSFGGDTSSVDSYIDQIVTHLQAFYCLDSLGTKVEIQKPEGNTYHSGYTWKADPDANSFAEVRPIVAASNADANLWVMMAKDQTYGYIGLAYVGVLCASKQYSCSINEKLNSVVASAEVVAHEMGHNLGMLHDFDDTHGGQGGPCDGTGFMSYGSAPQQWSTCSKNDFEAHYNNVASQGGWCLPFAATACGSPASPPPPPTEAPPPNPCGSPQWFGDNYCDDENNNAECGWDGGDCCGDNVNTQYCSACECLDPNAGGPTTTPAPPPPGTTTTAAPSPPPAGGCADMPSFMQNADRIVGGEAAPSMIPWQVALMSGSFQFCGGTILDSCTILTAAHCTPSTSHKIRAGSINKQTVVQERSIAAVISNPDLPYNGGTLNNDWAILKLSSELDLNDDVFPACLPSSTSYLSTSSTEERCFTSGWGTLSSGGSATNTLQWVRVPAITNAACNAQYGGSITDSMLCAGYPGVGGKDACQGDSGGPFVCNEGGKAIVAGVVSWGYGCADANYAGVYSRNTAALDWIKSSMGSCGNLPPSPPPPPPPSDACGSPQWFGDNYCDDENNNEECGWDGGDCCGDNVNTQYCSACECLDPNAGGPTTAPPPPVTTEGPSDACGSPQWFGDNYCDDDNNNEECGWDGGDCCGDNVNTQYCSACECLDPNAGGSTPAPPPPVTTEGPSDACGSPQWFGDNYCDDDNNNEECGWDGGDCCGDNVNTQYCSACECLDPNAGGPTTAPPPPVTTGGPSDACGSPQWFGDNYCDDDNNNEECGWDGGDCCGDNVNTQYCSACECLDPNGGGVGGTTEGPTNTTAAPSPPPASGECADMPSFMQNADRIVGGEAAPSMIPWQVALMSGSFQFCGGTILDSCTILTAAHCTPSTSHKIRAGSINKQTVVQERSIAYVVNNPDLPYNGGTLNNDWAILKLSSPLDLTADVFPACLPSSTSYLSTSSTEERCFTSGWGTLSSGGSATNTLQWVRVPAITNAACNAQYGGSITDSMICAGYPGVGGKDACQGDSGGPFVCNEGGKAIIAGVVSWGYGCADANYAGVYSRNTAALDWIKSSMGSCGNLPPAPPPPPPPSDACGSPQWFGDNYCDDDNNNEECGWDGGDCCGDNVNTQYCSACECLDPNAGGPTTAPPPPVTTEGPSDACGSPQWFGDNYCDDDNNNEECGWDGGDCCGDNVNTQYCSACECLDPNGGGNSGTTETPTDPPTTEEPCENDKSDNWCENKKQKGKCYNSNIANKCKKTCGVCGDPLVCEDYKPTSWCENKKAKGKCSKNNIKYKCALTCEHCTPVG